jgi:ABC-type antimicrobial peptide transport system permease subunit
MILKYVLKNFRRRRVRTVLMILALLVSTGLIVTMSATVETVRQSIVDFVASDVGRADLSVSKKDTSLDLYMPIEETAATMLAADDRIMAVHPRLEIRVETEVSGKRDSIWLIGLDSASDDIGAIEVVEGEYVLGDGRGAVTRWAANDIGLEVGDTLNVAYAIPIPRELGKAESSGASSVRLRREFTVSAIVNADGVAGRHGMLVEIGDLQTWLNLPGRAKQMLAVVDPALYETNSATAAALSMRDITRAVEQRLGDAYQYDMDLASTLSGASQVFLALQALINTYGLISLGVVGLLVYTLVMTNVQEQRRDMAVLRILGGQRNLLFGLVIVEVVVIGLVGVALGILLGQALTAYVLVPVLTHFLAEEGLTLRLVPHVTATAFLPPVVSAFTVLILSSLKPAREASRTKVMHAINPSAADNIQLEDLAQLRERRPDRKMFLAGTIMTLLFVLIAGFEALGEFGGEVLQVVFVMLGLAGLVLGISLVFFILTVPFERLVLSVMRPISPRLTYFARRNVSRGKTRNTLISLLVLFSAVLPSFLGTQAQLELANHENRTKMWYGAPVRIESLSRYWEDEGPEPLRRNFVHNELGAIAGIDKVVGISYPYASRAEDFVGLYGARVEVFGLDGDLAQVVLNEMVEFAAGGPEALSRILADPEAVVISEGLADHLAVELGEVIDLQGAGLDHIHKARVVGIARRIPGIGGITRSRIAAQDGSSVLVSMPHFRRLVTELNRTQPGPDGPFFETVLATLQPGADPDQVGEEIRDLYAEEYAFWVNLLEWELEENRGDIMFFVILLLALTGISFTTAVFAVFAVIYVTIYARRIEIGMLKSMGMLRRELSGMLIVEAIAMTLGSALAGIAAGASMGYLNFYINAALDQLPTRFAMDVVAMPAIIVMVVLASIVAAAFSSRRIVRKRAVEILRMS